MEHGLLWLPVIAFAKPAGCSDWHSENVREYGVWPVEQAAAVQEDMLAGIASNSSHMRYPDTLCASFYLTTAILLKHPLLVSS